MKGISITAVSDLHGHYPELEGGDLLIVAGDLTATDTPAQHLKFVDWLRNQKYKMKIFIAGNHDNILQRYGECGTSGDLCYYLCDSGTEFEYETFETGLDSTLMFTRKRKLKIYGSPWTLTFPGINPHCTAFTGDENLLAEKFALIPDDIDILVTHGPPLAVLDRTIRDQHVGSSSLAYKVASLHNIRLHVFGHIHEGYGIINPEKEYRPNYIDMCKHISVNCSHVNERYQPVNKPVRIVL